MNNAPHVWIEDKIIANIGLVSFTLFHNDVGYELKAVIEATPYYSFNHSSGKDEIELDVFVDIQSIQEQLEDGSLKDVFTDIKLSDVLLWEDVIRKDVIENY